jgi:hypothetical protein
LESVAFADRPSGGRAVAMRPINALATLLLGGKQRQQEVLEPLALGNLQPSKLNADFVVPIEAHDRAGSENRAHRVTKMQTDVD